MFYVQPILEILIFWRLFLWFFITNIFWSFFLFPLICLMQSQNLFFYIQSKLWLFSLAKHLFRSTVYRFDSMLLILILCFFVVDSFRFFVTQSLAFSVLILWVSKVFLLDFFQLIYLSYYWNLSINYFRIFSFI